MSKIDIFEAPAFVLQKGGVLPTARLAFKTLGELNSNRSNAVLVPSWYTGTHADSEMFMVGSNRALDPGKYFIVLRTCWAMAYRPLRATRRRRSSKLDSRM